MCHERSDRFKSFKATARRCSKSEIWRADKLTFCFRNATAFVTNVIPLVAFSGASLERVGARGLLAIGVLCGGVRWLVCGFSEDLAWIYPVQILHGVVVAGLVIGGPLYVEAVVPERLRSTGQGLLAMVGVSIGGISSQVSAGWLLEHVGSDAPYAVGGIGALVLACLVPVLLPATTSRPHSERDEHDASAASTD
jgi:MFS family permease